MKIIAIVPILYHGVQYKPGDEIKEFDLATLELWQKYKSVSKEAEGRQEDEAEAESEIPPREQISARKRAAHA